VAAQETLSRPPSGHEGKNDWRALPEHSCLQLAPLILLQCQNPLSCRFLLYMLTLMIKKWI
jgi:hypothetical protein